MKAFIDQILTSKKRVAFPIMTHPGIEALGKSVKEAVSNGRVHYEAIKYLSENYDVAAYSSIMDLTVEAEAFGATIAMPDHEVPSVTGRLVHDEASVSALVVPTLDKGRIPEYLLANKLAAENIPNKIIFSGCIGPFSLAGRLFDMSEIMTSIYLEPDTILELLEKCTTFLINYCVALKSCGTQGVIIAEPAAGLLSNSDCQCYSTHFVKKIVDAVQDDDFTVILHNCGNTGQCTEAMVMSEARGLHFGNAIQMDEVLANCPSNRIILGNLNPVSVFKQGTKESIRMETLSLLNKVGKYSNFVVSSGCDIPPHAPEENIQAFLDAVNEYNH